MMTREAAIIELQQKLHEGFVWDVIIIGGGATGLGAALEAVTRGYRTLLVEQADFAKSTSGKSTKLVHGGVRYLAQGNIALVREASVERGLLARNAPHLVHNTSFVIPAFSLRETIMYTLGLKAYDWLAGRLSLGRSRRLSKKETLERLPTLSPQRIAAGILYHDGQFDDTRLAVNLAQTITERGGLALNYMRVKGLTKNSAGKISGVLLEDAEDKAFYEVNTKSVINATGVFADELLQMDEPSAKHTITASQGVHLVLDKAFLPGADALMIPKTSDGRVLFAVPWHNKIVVGTTDTPVKTISLDPQALEQEIDFILTTAGAYLQHPPQRSDVRSVWAGLRPLAAPTGKGGKTKEISRSHKISISPAGLVSVIGGKWTTYRRMGEDVISQLEQSQGWPRTQSVTAALHVHGAQQADFNDPLYFYGADAKQVRAMANQEVLSESLGIITAQVMWAVRAEMARTVEDVLARRTRALFLDAAEAIRIAPQVASVMAKELDKDTAWEAAQITAFNTLASTYQL